MFPKKKVQQSQGKPSTLGTSCICIWPSQSRDYLLKYSTKTMKLFGQKILSYRWESIKKEEASKTFDQIWEPSEKARLFG